MGETLTRRESALCPPTALSSVLGCLCEVNGAGPR